MGNIIVTLIIFSILALAIVWLVMEKRRGVMCSGCPHGGNCSTKHRVKNKMKIAVTTVNSKPCC